MNKKVGDKWKDDEGNEFIVTKINGTVVISESVKTIEYVEEESEILN